VGHWLEATPFDILGLESQGTDSDHVACAFFAIFAAFPTLFLPAAIEEVSQSALTLPSSIVQPRDRAICDRVRHPRGVVVERLVEDVASSTFGCLDLAFTEHHIALVNFWLALLYPSRPLLLSGSYDQSIPAVCINGLLQFEDGLFVALVVLLNLCEGCVLGIVRLVLLMLPFASHLLRPRLSLSRRIAIDLDDGLISIVPGSFEAGPSRLRDHHLGSLLVFEPSGSFQLGPLHDVAFLFGGLVRMFGAVGVD
jgi:hypothetical protein